jgi:hypothetical protein
MSQSLPSRLGRPLRHIRHKIDHAIPPIEEHPHAIRCRRWRLFNGLDENTPFNPSSERPEPDEAWQSC